jgi:hypothetical protein
VKSTLVEVDLVNPSAHSCVTFRRNVTRVFRLTDAPSIILGLFWLGRTLFSKRSVFMVENPQRANKTASLSTEMTCAETPRRLTLQARAKRSKGGRFARNTFADCHFHSHRDLALRLRERLRASSASSCPSPPADAEKINQNCRVKRHDRRSFRRFRRIGFMKQASDCGRSKQNTCSFMPGHCSDPRRSTASGTQRG